MRNIVLFCAAGMSTSILVNKMRSTAKQMGYECEINAYAIADAHEKAANADIILLGPQVRFRKAEVEKLCNVPVEVIDTRAYGIQDAASILKTVKAKLGD